MQEWRQRVSVGVIRAARRMFADTPVQNFALTAAIKRTVFRFGYRENEITTVIRGVTLTIPNKDSTIVPGLAGGFYERIELDVFERLAAISKTIVDVGANVGLYCCVAAEHAPSSATIVAFEPVAENLGYLRKNIEQNGRAASVVVEAKAVGETGGSIDIFLVEDGIGTHSPSARNARGSTNSVSVPVTTLDDYAAARLRGPIDLLKVDVEGYEGSVLRGAAHVLREDKPTLFVEFIPGHLVNCDFPPQEFLDLIFEVYDHVFIVDEPRSTMRRCTKVELLDRSGYKNSNLIATSQDLHLAEVEAVCDSLGRN